MRGTAVVASDTAGQSDLVVDGETGYLLPPGKSEPIADRLLKLLADPDLDDRFGRPDRTMSGRIFPAT